MKIADCHAHVGWYSDGYHTPKEIWEAECAAGISEFAVSSTSTCAELYKLVVKEMFELQKLAGDKVHPILWVTPRMFDGRCRWALPYMLHSGIHWKGIKMHWWSHHAWYYNGKLLNNALDLVRKLNVPLLIHTGETKETLPKNFLPISRNNPDIKVILAHGRPPKDTIEVLHECSNVLVDTSFMPQEWKKIFVENGFANRLCFGTDIPINQLYWKDETTCDFIKRHLNELRSVTTEAQYAAIVQNNPYR